MALPTAADIVSNPGDIKSLFGLQPTLIDDLMVDLVLSHTISKTAQITERPVESGYPVTDARSIQPTTIVMEVIFTDPTVAGKDIAKNAIRGTLVQSLTTSWREKRDRLYEIFESDELIEVQIEGDSYRNITITDIVPEINAQLANCFKCTITMREIRLVSSAIGFVDPRTLPKEAKEKETAQQKTRREKTTKPKADKGEIKPKTGTKKQERTLGKSIKVGIFGE